MENKSLRSEQSYSEPTPDTSGQTRQKLLLIAQEVFVERGYYDATVREICQRAGLNIAMVNYHFGDKLGLYTEVLRRTSVTSKAGLLQHVEDPNENPESLLRELIMLVLQNMRRTEHAFDLLMRHERLRPTPAMEYLIESSMRPAYMTTCQLIGRILGLPAEHTATRLATHSVIAQLKHFGEPERLLTQLDPSILSDVTVERLADIIIDFSLASFRSLKRHDELKSSA